MIQCMDEEIHIKGLPLIQLQADGADAATKKRVVIVGMDPAASRNCGWAVLTIEGGKLILLEKATQTITREPDDIGRLEDIYQHLDALIAKYQPTILCTERQAGGGLIFVRSNLNEVVGIAKLCCFRRGVYVVEESPAHLKKIIAGHGRAKKKHVKANIVAAFGLKKAGPEHECDAAACALCCFIDLGWQGYKVQVPFN